MRRMECNSTETGVWLVNPQAGRIAEVIAQGLGATVFPCSSDRPQLEQFCQAFRSCRRWVVIGAAGIATRFVSGLLQDKHTDPAVVVVDDAGRFAVALVGGHEGGANSLAYAVANLLGSVPVVTTATETRKPLVVGIGCRKGVTAGQVGTAVLQALGDWQLGDVRLMATVDCKAAEPGLVEFCQVQAIPLRVIRLTDLKERSWVREPSEWVRQNLGVDGICEPCALLASGRGALIVPKTSWQGVAVAVVHDGDRAYTEEREKVPLVDDACSNSELLPVPASRGTEQALKDVKAEDWL